MIVDPKDINSGLVALTRLYGLLKQDGDGTCNSNSTTDLLDEHARVLLKNLLDAETERVLKEYSEVQQLDESPNKQPTLLSKLSLTAEAYQSHENNVGFISPQWNQACRPEQLMQSVVASGLEHTKKRCRLCQKNTINQLKPIEETHFYDDSEDSRKITNKSEDADRLSKEASEAIEHIELCMSALRIRADHSNMFDKGQSEERFTSRGDHPFEISSQSTMARPVGYSYPLHQVRCLAAEEMNQPFWLLDQASSLASRGLFLESDASTVECKFPTNNANTIIQPGNWIMGHYDFVPSQNHNVRNFGAQLEPIETPYTKMEAQYQPYKPPGNVSSTLGPHGKNHKKPSQDEILKNRKYISQSTTSDSYSNRMPSQRTSSRSSDSEENSSTDQTGEYLTSSTWSSESRSKSESNSYTSNNTEDNDDTYSSTSSVADLKSIGSSRSAYSSASKKLGLIRARKANGKKMGEKQTGMWKKMKDKMSIIFHHHHHHHHHHHDDDDRGKIKTKKGGLGKDINFSRQDGEAYGEKAVDKVKKSMMVRNKNQQSNFHGLVEGLLRHVRHSKSKTSKKGKETIGKLGKGHHDRQKSFKKSHWWKVMQHHRRNKLTNKTYAKLGLGKKKARLKALPHMK